MIDLQATRNGLGDLLAAGTYPAPLTVYRRAINGSPRFPLVWIGQPDMPELDVAPCGIDRIEIPICVAVGRDGTNEEATQFELEQLWPVVLSTLRGGAAAALAQVATVVAIRRAEFGSLEIQGGTFPAQILTLEIHG